MSFPPFILPCCFTARWQLCNQLLSRVISPYYSKNPYLHSISIYIKMYYLKCSLTIKMVSEHIYIYIYRTHIHIYKKKYIYIYIKNTNTYIKKKIYIYIYIYVCSIYYLILDLEMANGNGNGPQRSVSFPPGRRWSCPPRWTWSWAGRWRCWPDSRSPGPRSSGSGTDRWLLPHTPCSSYFASRCAHTSQAHSRGRLGISLMNYPSIRQVASVCVCLCVTGISRWRLVRLT